MLIVAKHGFIYKDGSMGKQSNTNTIGDANIEFSRLSDAPPPSGSSRFSVSSAAPAAEHTKYVYDPEERGRVIQELRKKNTELIDYVKSLVFVSMQENAAAQDFAEADQADQIPDQTEQIKALQHDYQTSIDEKNSLEGLVLTLLWVMSFPRLGSEYTASARQPEPDSIEEKHDADKTDELHTYPLIERFASYMLDRPDNEVTDDEDAGRIIRDDLQLSDKEWRKLMAALKKRMLVKTELFGRIANRYSKLGLSLNSLVSLAESSDPIATHIDGTIIDKARYQVAEKAKVAAAAHQAKTEKQIVPAASDPPPTARVSMPAGVTSGTLTAGETDDEIIDDGTTMPSGQPAMQIGLNAESKADKGVILSREERAEREARAQQRNSFKVALAILKEAEKLFNNFDHMATAIMGHTGFPREMVEATMTTMQADELINVQPSGERLRVAFTTLGISKLEKDLDQARTQKAQREKVDNDKADTK